jgi:PAS domain S-box-containing protein
MNCVNPFRRLRQSFRIRIFSLLTLLIVVTSAAFTSFYILHESAIATERLVAEGTLLVGILASNSRLAVFSEHPDMLKDAADTILQHDHVLNTTIFTIDGKPLINRARQLNEGIVHEWDGFTAVMRKTGTLLTGAQKTIFFEKDDQIEFYAPIISGPAFTSSESLFFSDIPTQSPGRPVGLARVVLDKNELAVNLHRLLMTGICMGVIFLVIGSALVFLITQGLTQPLNRLMDGVKTLELGNLSARIIVATDDELGEVSRAFNVMARTLERRETENRELGDMLRQAQKMEAKEEWERTFDTVPDLIAILDREHSIVRINRTMADRLGVVKEEAVGTRVYEQLHWSAGSANNELNSALKDSSAGYSGEIYQEKMQNYFLVTISPLRKKDGGISGSVYVARDVTKRKIAADLLQKSEERFRLIAETIVEVFWMAESSSNRVVYVSPGYERIWGIPPDTLYKNPNSFVEAIHPDDRGRVLADLELKKSGRPFDLEYRIIRPDGAIRWIWDRGYPVLGDSAQDDCYTGVAMDITDQKHAAEEKNAIQAKLVQTNKMTSLGLMVSGLGHEVNNPNNNIKLIAHLLARSWQDILPILEKQSREVGDFLIAGQSFSQAKEILPQHIAGIRDNSRRIEGIIKNLRDFGRKGTANMNIKVEINPIISVAAAIVNSQVKQYTRHFKLDLHEGLPSVRGNPQQLEQVVINLIMNGVQALPDRERKVLVSTSLARDGEFVIISVADEGTGMSPEVRDRIGELFFSTKLDQGGTGLGLAIANFIIKEHKGLLEFESEPGKGTTVQVKLPVEPHK